MRAHKREGVARAGARPADCLSRGARGARWPASDGWEAALPPLRAELGGGGAGEKGGHLGGGP